VTDKYNGDYLYHGTDTVSLRTIQTGNVLQPGNTGGISTTSDQRVAMFWAEMACFRQRREGDPSAKPVVLILDPFSIEDDGYDIYLFSDPVWGEGLCDWEQEERINGALENLDTYIIEVQHPTNEKVEQAVAWADTVRPNLG
jgi:hypothetical protein